MSRCFPFPPPGYEKKSRAEDADLLKKEKSKEKRHKKEKKEKEKGEGKEKREKDKSGEKQREKKDKKKDRDQKKDRDKEKEKAHASEESRPLGKIGSQNGDEFVSVKHKSAQEEKHAGQFDSYVGNKISQNIFPPKETKISKLVPEVGRSIEDSGIAKVEKCAGALPKRVDGMAVQVAWSSETLFEGKEHNKTKKIDERKYNGQGIRYEERIGGNSAVPSGNSAVPSFTAAANVAATATVESGVSGMFKPLENSAERRKETNDKIKQKEGEEKQGIKHKDKDKEKKGRSSDKDHDKEKKKEKKEKKAKEKEKAKEKKVEEKNSKVDKTKEISKDNLLGRHSTNVSTNTSPLPGSNIGAAVEENLIKKRKDFEPNGILHAIDNRSSKLFRPSSHLSKENGRILEPCLTSTLPPSERQAVASDLILVSKERKINGVNEAHPPPDSSVRKSGGQDGHFQPTPIHKKLPHPDCKYLSVVYSVPKMEELSNSDNQDWLFSSSTSQVMMPKLEASKAEETPQVWAEAMQIESTDVFALPYVIPY